MLLIHQENEHLTYLAHRGGSWALRQMGRQKEKPSEKLRQRTLELILHQHWLRLLHSWDPSFEQNKKLIQYLNLFFLQMYMQDHPAWLEHLNPTRLGMSAHCHLYLNIPNIQFSQYFVKLKHTIKHVCCY